MVFLPTRCVSSVPSSTVFKGTSACALEVAPSLTNCHPRKGASFNDGVQCICTSQNFFSAMRVMAARTFPVNARPPRRLNLRVRLNRRAAIGTLAVDELLGWRCRIDQGVPEAFLWGRRGGRLQIRASTVVIRDSRECTVDKSGGKGSSVIPEERSQTSLWGREIVPKSCGTETLATVEALCECVNRVDPLKHCELRRNKPRRTCFKERSSDFFGGLPPPNPPAYPLVMNAPARCARGANAGGEGWGCGCRGDEP